MQSADILEELVASSSETREFCGADFEQLEEYWALADARLSAFSSEKMWAVAIEIVGYDARADEFALHVYLFGNCLNLESAHFDFRRTILTTPNNWNKEIEKDQVWGLARDQFSLLFRGKRHDFAPSLEELKDAGIELSRRETASGLLSAQQMLRYVCEKMDHPFFMGEDALRDLLDSFALSSEWKYDHNRVWYENELGEFDEPPILSLTLELILQTRDWTHPREGLADRDAGEWEISPRAAFATLAQTIATRDVAVWNAQNPANFNSHWRHWAEIEAENERIEVNAIDNAKTAFYAYFMQTLPSEARIEFLRQLRPALEEAPYFANGSEIMTIERDRDIGGEVDTGVRVFRELVGEIDVMLAILQNNR